MRIKGEALNDIISYFQESAKQSGALLDVECYCAGDGRTASTPFAELEVLANGKIRAQIRTLIEVPVLY